MKKWKDVRKGTKKVLVTAIVGAILWTIALTPYFLFVTKMSSKQYWSWIVMQFVLVPPIAPLVFWVTGKAVKKWG